MPSSILIFLLSEQVEYKGGQEAPRKVRLCRRRQGSPSKIRARHPLFFLVVALLVLAPKRQFAGAPAGQELHVRRVRHAICAEGLVGQPREAAREGG